MGDLAEFCRSMRWWCDYGNLGYDQDNRWDIRVGGECDCSSLVIFCLREAGFDTGDASYTGDLSSNLTDRGWERLSPDISDCRPGDILLNDVHHVCAVVEGYGWDALISQASIDERGRARGGSAGDQTDRETITKPVYIYSHGWDCILRYKGDDDEVKEEDFERIQTMIDNAVASLLASVGHEVWNYHNDNMNPGRDAYQMLTDIHINTVQRDDVKYSGAGALAYRNNDVNPGKDAYQMLTDTVHGIEAIKEKLCIDKEDSESTDADTDEQK